LRADLGCHPISSEEDIFPEEGLGQDILARATTTTTTCHCGIVLLPYWRITLLLIVLGGGKEEEEEEEEGVVRLVERDG